VVLIPSAAYLLVMRIRSSRKTPSLVRKHLTKLIVIALAAVVGVAIYLYATNFYFRLSVLPPFKNSLTVGGYTMFSGKHILDWMNLLVMLFPGILVIAASAALHPRNTVFSSTETRFLLVLTISGLIAVFALDPKLGMPRDWDLFSFCGIPLVALGFYVTVRLGETSRWAGYAVLLALALNFLVLTPRVVSQSSPRVSERVIEAYIRLDESRSRTAQYTLLNYLEGSGRGDEGERLSRTWDRNSSQNAMLVSADTLIARGQYRSALTVLDTLVELNPGIPGVWSKRGHCYFALGQYDSCVSSMKVAIGLNPYNSSEVFNLALVEYHLGHYDAAIEHYERAARLDTANVRPLIGLAESFAAVGDTAMYRENLVTLGSRPDAPLKYVKELGDYYWNNRDYSGAAELYKRAIGMGLDSSYVKARLDSASSLRTQPSPK
jgi:tetratricopeptide (TPR) repeat protein